MFFFFAIVVTVQFLMFYPTFVINPNISAVFCLSCLFLIFLSDLKIQMMYMWFKIKMKF